MSSYKQPRHWHIVNTLERNQLGKVNKKGIKQSYIAELSC